MPDNITSMIVCYGYTIRFGYVDRYCVTLCITMYAVKSHDLGGMSSQIHNNKLIKRFQAMYGLYVIDIYVAYIEIRHVYI